MYKTLTKKTKVNDLDIHVSQTNLVFVSAKKSCVDQNFLSLVLIVELLK